MTTEDTAIRDGYKLCEFLLERQRNNGKRLWGRQAIADAMGYTWSLGRVDYALWAVRKKKCPPYLMSYQVGWRCREFTVIDTREDAVLVKENSSGTNHWLHMGREEFAGQIPILRERARRTLDPVEKAALNQKADNIQFIVTAIDLVAKAL